MVCVMLMTSPVHGKPVRAAGPVVGKPAPDFEITLMDGSRITLAQLRGQVIVLNFWATWCVPCRTELPTLDAYYEAERKHGMRAFAITTEGSLPAFRLRQLFKAMKMDSARKVTGG
jgi:cytochrome c biogenesis protein CcmG, thiol:disulfide interchange protein DsbE